MFLVESCLFLKNTFDRVFTIFNKDQKDFMFVLSNTYSDLRHEQDNISLPLEIIVL